MRLINEIIIHCAATAPTWMNDQPTSAKVAEIRRWHKARGWRDIGYHFVIDRDGTVAEGRGVSVTGAHVKGRNRNTIGICLLGGKGSNERDKFEEHFEPAQADALRDLIARLKRDIPTIKTVSGHNQYAAKACPGFNAPEWYASRTERPVDRDDTRPAPEPPAEEGGFLAALVAFFTNLFGGRA